MKEFHTEGIAKLPLTARNSDLKEVECYLLRRASSRHPGNIWDSAGRFRAAHGYEAGLLDDLIALLAEQAKVLIQSRQVYIYQYRVNSKHPSTLEEGAGAWQLHRDFDFWHYMDGMPDAQAVVFHLLVTDISYNDGPLVVCNRSHRDPLPPHNDSSNLSWEDGFKEDLRYTIDARFIEEWKNQTLLVGQAGALYAMHPMAWHYSGLNLSHSPRILMSVAFNSIDNMPKKFSALLQRPSYITEDPTHRF
ncbi:MAG: phytanoyl-CoA dioxygenase family protein [Gammaproteobacteria bacterium]|nr:phytanoyl-CoA dioxygenase family protein [Gammaproteobacteria bacterium]